MRILSQAPTRISLAGGGTDLESYSNEFGGFVVNLAINIPTHIFINTDSSNIFNQYPTEADPSLFDLIIKLYGTKKLHVISSFDGKIGAGLGSSASATVALLGALVKANNILTDPFLIAKQAYLLEAKEMKWTTGKQDQYAASVGGMNGWRFGSNEVEQMSVPRFCVDAIYPYLFLTYIGKRQRNHLQDDLMRLNHDQIQILSSMKEIARDMFDAVMKRDIIKIAELIQASWALKKASNKKISDEKIDAIYRKAMNNGAMAGKLLGSGGGGYMLFLVSPDKRSDFIKRTGLEEVDFMPDYSGLSIRKL